MNNLFFSSNEIKGSLPEILDSGGKIPIVVSGYSMRPFLEHAKDTVWVRSCNKEDIKVNDILLYKRKNGSLILHRIVKLLPDNRLLMCGDAQVDCEVIERDCIIGIVYEIERKSRRFSADSNHRFVNLWRIIRPFRPIVLKLLRLLKIC